MSCCVGAMRVKMLRRLICMVSRLSGGRKNSTFSSSRSSEAKKASSCCFGAGGGFLRHGERQLAAACELEPFIGDDHHGLRQIERGEGRIDRQRDDAVGERDLVVFEPVALAAEQDARRFRPTATRGAISAAASRRARSPAWPGRGRARWWQGRSCSRRWRLPACRRARRRRGCGRRRPPSRAPCRWARPARGLTSRSRDRPKLAMARAAAPIFSPSCGSTRTTTGPGSSLQRLVLSVPAPGMQCSSARKCRSESLQAAAARPAHLSDGRMPARMRASRNTCRLLPPRVRML